MGRGRGGRVPFRFFWNRSEALATNVYLLLMPREPLARRLTEEPGAGRAVLDFLRGIPREEWVKLGRVYGGGLYKVEPRELARLDARPLIEALRALALKFRVCRRIIAL